MLGSSVRVSDPSATDVRLDGDEMTADADDGNASHASGTYMAADWTQNSIRRGSSRSRGVQPISRWRRRQLECPRVTSLDAGAEPGRVTPVTLAERTSVAWRPDRWQGPNLSRADRQGLAGDELRLGR